MPRADPLRQGAQKWLLRACVALPLLMLGANLLAWLFGMKKGRAL